MNIINLKSETNANKQTGFIMAKIRQKEKQTNQKTQAV